MPVGKTMDFAGEPMVARFFRAPALQSPVPSGYASVYMNNQTARPALGRYGSTLSWFS